MDMKNVNLTGHGFSNTMGIKNLLEKRAERESISPEAKIMEILDAWYTREIGLACDKDKGMER